MIKKILINEMRTPEQIQEHYEIEKKLASKLRESKEEERSYLYTALYDELFRLVPHHPLLTKKADPQMQFLAVSEKMEFLKHLLNSNSIFIEVGAGDCSLSLEVSKYVKKVYAIDVSENITRNKILPQNFKLIISDGVSIPVPEDSVTIAYSNQLMEHLHPDDAFKQLKNIYKVLANGGIYICITPNRLTGPHDISKYFDQISTGFHLKEYTITELSELFRQVGFSQIELYKRLQGNYIKLPLFPIKLCEKIIDKLPFLLKKIIVSTWLFRLLLDIRIVGKKE
jgi:ubiquinone/menaquinone biosynthesis C-methylase UbiE